jgi:16S rRNA (cytidine1402-2'-O)-methyltransferase
VADPGAALVRAAHAAGLRVAPLVGPSALLLALMACGMNGQRFTFHGYLPVDAPARAARLLELERESEARQETQLFIEVPYRNDVLLAAILQTCATDTLLCLATDLTSNTEAVRTQAIADWKRDQPRLARRPTVFLLYRDSRPRPPRKRRREGRA